MGLIDNIKKFFTELTEPKTEEYQSYKKSKEIAESDIRRFNKYLADGVDDRQRWEYVKYEKECSLKFIRPNTNEDIEYRNKHINTFAEKLKEVSKNLDLRFHGTPVYFAEQIIKNGNISSSADRFDGYDASTDGRGLFSVSDMDSLSRTVDFFMDKESHNRCLPCGCLFVLTPGNQTEEQRRQSVMERVDFFRDPERLYSVVTTPENIENVKSWMMEVGFTTDKVHTFDEFIEVAREASLALESREEVTVDLDMIIDEDKILEESRNDHSIDTISLDQMNRDDFGAI